MNEHSHIRIESPAFASESIHVLTLTGREAISQLFEFHAQVASSDPEGLDVDALIGAPATLVFERGGVETRRLGGLVASIRDSMHEETGKPVYDLWFAPRAFRLGLVETYEIFMDLSVPDIVKKKLERAGLVETADYALRLTAPYAPREFVVQYQETDLAFISRLLEHVGVSFFFEHKDGKDLLVFSDNNSGFGPPVEGEEVPFLSRGERQGVFSLESHTRMTPAQYVVKDYNYRTPQLALQASAPHDKGDGGFIMEYGAHFKNPDEGAIIAKIRAEELAAGRTILDGKSDRQGFSAGVMLLLEGHPRGDLPLLVTEVHHRASTTALGTGKENARDYENTFKAIPGKTPFRPARITPKPRIHGVITGVIDAAAKGPYAELDTDGRYRVRFLFDAGEAGDGQASRLCRMAQPHGGGGYGMHFPLRSGVEVILTFVEGDPDRPIIVGVVPNPQTPSPVTGGNGTRNIIRTGGGNEINIDDTAGAERIKMSTPFGKTTFQLGAKNCPDEGIVTCTEAHVTTNAEKSVNSRTPLMNLAGDFFNFLSAKDMTYYCTPLINVLAVTNAVLAAVGHVDEIAKHHLVDTHTKWLEGAGEKLEEKEAEARASKKEAADEQAKADEATKDEKAARDSKQAELDAARQKKAQKQAALDAKNREIQAKEAELASVKAQLAVKQSGLAAQKADDASKPSVFGFTPPSTSTAALDAEIVKLTERIAALEKELVALRAARESLEGEIRALDAQIAALEQDIKSLDDAIAKAQEPVKAAEAKAESNERAAATLQGAIDQRKAIQEASSAKEASEWVDNNVKGLGGGLLSSGSAVVGWLAQKAADANLGLVVGAANRAAPYGRMPYLVAPILGSSNFTGGATNGAALVSDVHTIVGSLGAATFCGGMNTAVLSNSALALKGGHTELASAMHMLVSAGTSIDLQAGRSVEMVAKSEHFSATAGTEMKLEGTTNMVLTSKKGATMTADEGLLSLASPKGDISLKAHGDKKSSVILGANHATVAYDTWGITMQADRVDIGKAPRKNESFWMTDKTITMKRGGGVVSVADNNLALKGGKTTISLVNSGLVVKGTRIDLG